MDSQILSLRKYREEKERKDQGETSSLKDILSQAIGPDKVEELRFEEPKLKPGVRVFWVIDAIAWLQSIRENMYFVNSTNPELRAMFPEVPVK